MEEEKKEKTEKYDRECARCANIFWCKGKPPGVKLCINLVERNNNG